MDLAQNCYLTISKCLEKVGNTKKLLYYFKKHKQYNNSLLHKKTNPKIADLEIQFGTTYKEKQFIAQQAKAIKKK